MAISRHIVLLECYLRPNLSFLSPFRRRFTSILALTSTAPVFYDVALINFICQRPWHRWPGFPLPLRHSRILETRFGRWRSIEVSLIVLLYDHVRD